MLVDMAADHSLHIPRRWASFGFALFELVVALAVVAPLVLGLAVFLSHRATAEKRANYIAAEARELALIDKVLRKVNVIHKADHDAGWYDDQAHPGAGYTLLIDQDHVLPDGFANRFGALGTSPFNQPYGMLAWGYKDSAGKHLGIGWLVHERGEATPGLLSRIGVKAASPAAIGSLKHAIADEAMRSYGIHAAVVDAGSLLAIAPDSGWSINLAGTYDTSAAFASATQPRVVVFVNNPELERESPVDGQVPTDSGPWDSVSLVVGKPGSPGYPAVDSQCPAGTQEMLKFPTCGYGTNNNNYFIYDTAGGPITFSHRIAKPMYALRGRITNKPCGGGAYGYCVREGIREYGYEDQRDILLSGAQIGTDGTCAWRGWVQGRVWANADKSVVRCRTPNNATASWVGFSELDPWEGCSEEIVDTTVPPYPYNRLCGVPANAP